MATTTRKQRELKQREQLFLDVGRQLLIERGFFGLNMDRIAELTEYSKGTVYQHFSCKEDIVAALTAQTMDVRRTLFERAATFRGRPRERMTALGVADRLFYTAYHDHFRTEQICKLDSVWEKATDERRAQVMQAEEGCFSTMTGVLRDAVAEGDLVLEEVAKIDIGGLLFGLSSMAWGGRSLMSLGITERKFRLADAEATLARNFQLYLDGCQWRPLSAEWDYQQVVERVRAEIFSAEWSKTYG